jgi:hypothetical protein
MQGVEAVDDVISGGQELTLPNTHFVNTRKNTERRLAGIKGSRKSTIVDSPTYYYHSRTKLISISSREHKSSCRSIDLCGATEYTYFIQS